MSLLTGKKKKEREKEQEEEEYIKMGELVNTCARVIVWVFIETQTNDISSLTVYMWVSVCLDE